MTRRAPSAATADDVLRYVAGYEMTWGYSPNIGAVADSLFEGQDGVADRALHLLEARGALRISKTSRLRRFQVLTPIAVPRIPTGAPLYFVRVAQ